VRLGVVLVAICGKRHALPGFSTMRHCQQRHFRVRAGLIPLDAAGLHGVVGKRSHWPKFGPKSLPTSAITLDSRVEMGVESIGPIRYKAFGLHILPRFFRLFGSSAMSRERKAPFDPRAFLAKADGGRTISNTRRIKLSSLRERRRMLFSTSSKARSKSPLSPSKAKKRSLRSLERAISLAKDAW
jgi:hypothetical protein